MQVATILYVFSVTFLCCWNVEAFDFPDIFTVSNTVTREQFKCMHDNGSDWAMIRIYQPSGAIDPNAVMNMQNADAVGLISGAYISPNFAKGDARGQIHDALDNVKDVIANLTLFAPAVFLYIGPNTWGDSMIENRAFIVELGLAAKEELAKWDSVPFLGIYSSQSYWRNITGDVNWDVNDVVDDLLWYGDATNKLDCSGYDLVEFGGFKTANIMQYAENQHACDLIFHSSAAC